VLETYAAIKSDLAKASYAAFPLEVALTIAHENEPSFTLYAALALGLDSLAAWRGDVRAHASWQALQLLGAAGFEPSMESCVDCGRPVSGAPGFAWRGGVTCAACPADVRLASEQYACLRGMVENRDSYPMTCAGSGNGAGVYSTVFGAVFRVVRHYAARQLETDFRSVRVIDQLFLEKG
jgi:recombinational DNA repair protein (RecF pathway)